MLTNSGSGLDGDLKKIFYDAIYETYMMDLVEGKDIDASIKELVKTNAEKKAEKFSDMVAAPLSEIISNFVSQMSAPAASTQPI